MLFADAATPVSPWLPLLVFVAELCVVTLATMRTIFVARGMKALAPLLGFFEVSIWLFAIGQIMRNLTDPGCYFGFAGGFTLGNYLGVVLEKRLAIGTVVVRIITHRETGALSERLKEAGYGVTSFAGQGGTGPVKMVFTVIKRKELPNVVAHIEAFDPTVFYSVDEIQSAAAGIFPEPKARVRGMVPSLLLSLRENAVVGQRVTMALDETGGSDALPAFHESIRLQ